MLNLLSWLGSLGTAITAWGARKGLVASAYTASFLGAFLIYIACMRLIRDLVSNADISLSTGAAIAGGSAVNWLVFVAMFVPSNLANCVSILVDAYICRYAFLLVVKYITALANSN